MPAVCMCVRLSDPPCDVDDNHLYMVLLKLYKSNHLVLLHINLQILLGFPQHNHYHSNHLVVQLVLPVVLSDLVLVVVVVEVVVYEYHDMAYYTLKINSKSSSYIIFWSSLCLTFINIL